MKRNRKLVALLALAACSVGAIVYAIPNKKPTDEEIRVKFACNRLTTVVLPTDAYCEDPNLYRQHLKSGSVIKD